LSSVIVRMFILSDEVWFWFVSGGFSV